MVSKKIFDYKTDWFQYFESILKNEDEENIRNLIKGNIVESNFSSIEEFAKQYDEIKLKPSKETYFYNVKVKSKNQPTSYLYIDTENPRFWVIHNIESHEIKNKIKELFWNSFLQDRIYLPNEMMKKYWKKYSSDSRGLSVKFNQLFFNENDELDNNNLINYTMRLWPKRSKSMEFFFKQFEKIGFPINLNYLNYEFIDESNGVIMKENFYHNGRFTIEKGQDFHKHLEFIELIRKDYNSKIDIIEDYRIDWEKTKGELFVIQLNLKIDPTRIYNVLRTNRKKFKIYIFELYKEHNYNLYNCIDEHTGGKFTLQIFNDKIYINLDKNSCGNLVLRLFSKLQRYFSPNINLEIDNQEIAIES